MKLSKKFEIFFKNDVFYIHDYNNGIAIFRTNGIDEDGFLSYYDIISSIDDDSLLIMEENIKEYHEYTIKDIYLYSDYIVEINQLDVFTIKSDTLFSNIRSKQDEKFI